MSIETGGEPQNENDRRKPPPEWGARTRFGLQQQPSSEAKKAGWARKKRNRQLAQMLLNRMFVGKIKEGEVIVDSKFRKNLKEYFGLDENELGDLTNEAAIMLRMIGAATADGDMQAASLILERAYGKPKELMPTDEEEEASRPQINITVVQQLDLPPIKENEEDDTIQQ